MSSTFSLKKSHSEDFGRLRRQILRSENDLIYLPKRFDRDDYSGMYSSWSSDVNLENSVLPDSNKFPSNTFPKGHSFSDSSSSDDDTTATMHSIEDKRKWNVGKLSVMMLLLFGTTDLLLNLVDAQMDSLVAPDHYDALSADVIRPAFRYHSSPAESTARKPRARLGSAAMSSVNASLSPILPFSGGTALRREDDSSNSLTESFYSVVEQIKGYFTTDVTVTASPSFKSIPRGGSTKTKSKSKTRQSNPQYNSALSASEPFVPLKEIADLTLKDVSLAFRYAIESTRKDFNLAKFTSGVVPRVKKTFDKMAAAAAESRGKVSKAPVTGLSTQSGDIDALNFCAAMRIFAEWRVLRQVPEGYKGYAVGMSLGQKDIIQNVAKVESAVHNYIEHQTETFGDAEGAATPAIMSPTLRDLLQFEVDNDVHDKLPRLKEKSAGMGLLWVRRQLHYQTALFANVLLVPKRFQSTRDAVTAAYKEVYDRYHGWAIQKIFSYSFQAAPDSAVIYKVMNPERLKEVTEMVKSNHSSPKKNTDSHRGHFSREEGSSSPFARFGRHIGREWEKLTGSVVQIFVHNKRVNVEPMRGGSEPMEASQQLEMENLINDLMEQDAHEHIEAYLAVAKPLLDDLASLFQQFNMDDPTKV